MWKYAIWLYNCSCSYWIQDLNSPLIITLFLYFYYGLFLSHLSHKIIQYLWSIPVSAKIFFNSEEFFNQIETMNEIILVKYFFPPLLSQNLFLLVNHRKPAKNTNLVQEFINNNSTLSIIQSIQNCVWNIYLKQFFLSLVASFIFIRHKPSEYIKSIQITKNQATVRGEHQNTRHFAFFCHCEGGRTAFVISWFP